MVALALRVCAKSDGDGKAAVSSLTLSGWGDDNITEMLLEAGADPNPESHFLNGETLLCRVIRAREFATAIVLLRHGANPNMQYGKTRRPLLNWVVEHGDLSLLNEMLNAKAECQCSGRQRQYGATSGGEAGAYSHRCGTPRSRGRRRR